jgi:hypothetical protein
MSAPLLAGQALPDRFFQFGRTSVLKNPQDIHTIRGPKTG